MANTTRNGILQVSDSSAGSGTPVSIVDPIGAEPSADSVSVTLATDQAPIHTIVDNASIPVTGPLTNTELRAVAISISATSLPLPTGAATEATLSAVKAKTDNLDVLLSTRTKPSDQQHSIVDSSVLPTGAATAALQTQPGIDIGDVTVNNAAGAAAVNIQDGGNSITVDAVSLPLPTGASTETTLALIKAKTDNIDVALSTRTKPTDQQHVIVDLGTVIAVTGGLTDTQLRATPIPVSGTVTTTPPANASTNLTQVNGAAVSLGAKASANSIPVVLATDEASLPITAAVLPLPTNAAQEIGGNLDTIRASLTDRTQKTQITDGAREVSVKDSSTPPVAADKALVVGIRQVLAAGESLNIRSDSASSLTSLNISSGTSEITGFTSSNLIVITASAIGNSHSIQFAISTTLTGNPVPIRILNLKTGLWVTTIEILPNTSDNIFWVGDLSGVIVTVSVLTVIATGVIVIEVFNHLAGPAPWLNQSQESGGNLEVIANGNALVSDSRESYLPTELKPLSLTTDGRLRVATSLSDVDLDFFAVPIVNDDTWDSSSAWG